MKAKDINIENRGYCMLSNTWLLRGVTKRAVQ